MSKLGRKLATMTKHWLWTKKIFRLPSLCIKPVNDHREVMAILPYTKMPDTDELSFEKGEIFRVHNNMGDGWWWVTSKSTGKSGIVYGEFMQEVMSQESVESSGWFHDNITREEAGHKLVRAGPGSYLVRPSETTPGDYTLFVHCSGCIQKFKIVHQGRQFVMGGRYFESLQDIIERYHHEQIVEGQTLEIPVLRDLKREIYSTMRQSSGSNFFLNNNKVVLKGYLNKKSHKTKKWKNFYFVLNETEQQLIYFENEKRSKPKGLIELTNSSLYPVHDSFFGRPNCFQLVVRSLNQESYMYYFLCAESSDCAQKWVQELRKHCSNTASKVPQHNASSALKQLRSLTVCIKDAKKLSSKHVTQPYCIICLNSVQVCRTQAKGSTSQDPVVWEEEFILDDIPPDINKLTIKVCNKSKRSKDTDVAEVSILLDELPNGEVCDKWYQLTNNNSPTTDIGDIRLQTKFTHEIVMPPKEYGGLKELLLAKDLETTQALTEVCSVAERKQLARALLQIFRHAGQEASLLQRFNDLEIESEEQSAQLFRGTSMATTLMDQYMRMTTPTFLSHAVGATINKIMESKQSAEVNPVNLESPADAEANALYLSSLLNEAVETIFMSTEHCPVVLRYIFRCLQNKVMAKWPNDNLVKTRAVSGFIFLRLLCPAILQPRSFNLITETPSNTAARSLKLVANSMIKLANLVESKEHHMEAVVNPFIRKNKERMVMFLDELSNVPDKPTVPEEPPSADVARHLACVHQIAVANLAAINRLRQSKPHLKKLVTVTDMLTQHKKHYMGL